MPQFNLVSRIHVLSVIREYDGLGADVFHSTYGPGSAREYLLRHRGRVYDAGAILGVAHRKATGTLARNEDVSGNRAVRWLEELGFEVVHVDPNPPPARPRPRASSTRPPAPCKSTARSAKPEPAVVLCPRCFTQLSTTGVCGYCD